MAPLFSSVMQMLLGLVLEGISSVLLDAYLIDLISPVSCPPILWSLWNSDDHRRWFFFFFLVTLGIMSHIKWVVAALRRLWPRGMLRLVELMFQFVGLLGFLLVSSCFRLWFKTSPFLVFIFHLSEKTFFYFLWENFQPSVPSVLLAMTLLWRVVQWCFPSFSLWGTLFFSLSVLSFILM